MYDATVRFLVSVKCAVNVKSLAVPRSDSEASVAQMLGVFGLRKSRLTKLVGIYKHFTASPRTRWAFPVVAVLFCHKKKNSA